VEQAAVQQPQRQHPGRSCSPIPLGLWREPPSISGPALLREAREAAGVQVSGVLAEAVREGVQAKVVAEAVRHRLLSPLLLSAPRPLLLSAPRPRPHIYVSSYSCLSIFMCPHTPTGVRGTRVHSAQYSPRFLFLSGASLSLPDQVGEGERDCCGRLAALGDGDVRPERLRLGQANVRLREQLSVKDGLLHALQVSLHTY
jgi:hypothetical protein